MGWIEIALLVAVLAWIGLVAWGLKTLATPTQGQTIAADAQARAVIVVGMQEMFTRGKSRHAPPKETVERLIAAINTVADRSAARGIPVLYVRNAYGMGPLAPIARLLLGAQAGASPPGAQLDSALTDVQEVFAKPLGDAFSSDELDRYLRRRSVGEVVVMGMDGIACVQRTARGALNRGYRVVLPEDGIATGAPQVWRRWLAKLEGAGAVVSDVEMCFPAVSPDGSKQEGG